MTREPMTPVAVEDELRKLYRRLDVLRTDLVDARNAENEAKAVFEIAKVNAGARPECPVIQRGSVTIKERQEFIDAAVLQELLALQDAKTKRVIAADALRTAQKQVEIVQSVGASVRQSYPSPHAGVGR